MPGVRVRMPGCPNTARPRVELHCAGRDGGSRGTAFREAGKCASGGLEPYFAGGAKKVSGDADAVRARRVAVSVPAAADARSPIQLLPNPAAARTFHRRRGAPLVPPCPSRFCHSVHPVHTVPERAVESNGLSFRGPPTLPSAFRLTGCRAEESTVGLLEGGRGSPRQTRGRATAGQGQCRARDRP